MPRADRSVRLFRNRLLEHLSLVHPVFPVLFWTPVIGWLLQRSVVVHHLGAGTVVVLAGAGLAVWSLAEYVIHRFVFHLAPSSPGGKRLQYIVHGVHHDHPRDPLRLLMPPAPAAVVATMLYGLFRVVLGPAWVDPFFASFLTGYLLYDYTHLALHRRNPRTRLGRYLRRRHMLHHFVTPDARWGVTSPFWDWVFRTTGEEGTSQKRIAVGG
jgi:dihydroceramide fatty acyl 2-hydroxylase